MTKMTKMTKMTGWLLSAVMMLGLLFALLGPAPSAHACSCAMPVPPAVELERHTAVFAGTVIGVNKKEFGRIQSTADPVPVLFQVKEIWKGIETSQVIVYTAWSSASCGYEGFQAGTDYIVYASETEDRLKTNLCTRTAPLSQAGEDLAALGAGTEPRLTVNLEHKLRDWPTSLITAGLVIAIAVPALVLWVWRLNRRRRNLG